MDPILSEVSQAGTKESRPPLLIELEKHRITSDKVLPPMEFLFTLFDEPCFPRRELVAMTGRAKSGKTFVLTVLMAGAVLSEALAFKSASPLRVLWYDTEQSDNSTQDILKNRIRPMWWRVKGRDAPFPEQMFDIFNVRNVDRDKREEFLIEAIGWYRPDLVILDGIRDLVGDINDGTVAQELIERLMRTAQQYGCCIVCVLHQNKSGESRDPRGWLGTELLNKAFDVFATEKLMPQRIFKLEQLYTRKYDIEQDLYFNVDEEGLPCQMHEGDVPREAMQTTATGGEERTPLNEEYVIHKVDGGWEMDVTKLFTTAFVGYDSLTGAALRYRVMELGHIETQRLYNYCLDRAMKMGLMEKSHDKLNHVIYRLQTAPKIGVLL